MGELLLRKEPLEDERRASRSLASNRGSGLKLGPGSARLSRSLLELVLEAGFSWSCGCDIKMADPLGKASAWW